MRLAVKDWFHEKKMNEMKKDVQCTDIYAILKETEKAYNVFVGDVSKFMTYWVPKSCVIEVPEVDEFGAHHRECLIDTEFDEVLADWRAEMRFYR